MALITDPLDAIDDVSNANEAARLRDDLRQTLSTRSGLSPKWERDAKQAIEWAENEYPEINQRAFGQGRREGLGGQQRRYKQSGKATTRTGRNKPQKPAQQPKRPASTARRAAGAANRRTGRAAGRARGRVDRAVEQTGLPGLGRSATAISLQVLGVVVGLSFMYLLLRDAAKRPGSSAIETITGGVASGVRLLIDPVDPFRAPDLADPRGPIRTSQRTAAESVGNAADAVADAVGRSRIRQRRRPAHAPNRSPAGARR